MLVNTTTHLTDREFFTYVKFSDMIINKRNLGEEDVVGATMFTLGEENDPYHRFLRIYDFAQTKKLSVIVGLPDYDLKDQVAAYIANKTKADDQNDPTEEELLKICKKINSGKSIKYADTGRLSWVWNEVYNSTKFTPYEYNFSDQDRSEVQSAIDSYLENLINNKLIISKKNYYTFNSLKELFIALIEGGDFITKFGKNFVIEKEINSSGELIDDPHFCLLQATYALQHLEYLEINNLWCKTLHSTLGDQRRYFLCINITVNESLISEINETYQKNNPRRLFESFDKEKAVLKIAGKEISLSAKGRETGSVMLMDTLIRRKNEEWLSNSDIFDDWDYNPADIYDAPKNKICFIAIKLNELIERKTGILDFVMVKTNEVRINPKYFSTEE